MACGRGPLAIGLTGVLSALALGPATAGPRVEVDGRPVRGPRAYVFDGRVMVPVRGVIERLPGTRVHWARKQKRLVISRGGRSVRLHVNSGYAQVGGSAVPLDALVAMRGRRTLMPARFVSEVLGARVRYEPERQVVSITSTGSTALALGYRSDRPTPNRAPGQVAIGGTEILALRTPAGHPSLEARAAPSPGTRWRRWRTWPGAGASGAGASGSRRGTGTR